MFFETIIIGAGAAGLFCGAALKDYKRKFLIIEKSSKVGLKLLASGSGQCNFTHSGDIKDFTNFYGENGKKIRGILFRFNNQMIEEYFNSLGLKTITREDGKVFPATLKAEDIRSCLLKEISKNKGEVLCQRNVISISQSDSEGIYKVIAEDKDGRECSFTCKNLVIAAGGKSYPKTGSDGKIMETIKAFDDFEIVEQKAALVPIYIEGHSYERLSGISIKGAQIKKGKIKASGDLLFTHRNFSGPLILNFSRYLNQGDIFEIDYLPSGFKGGQHLKGDGEKRAILNYLIEETALPKAMLEVFLGELNINSKEKTASLGGKKIKGIEEAIRCHRYLVNGKAGLDKAMVTCGGISLKEVSTRSLQSKKHPGLYFIGEILDVDGDTGGYNIQFAFSSGYAAAQHISQLP